MDGFVTARSPACALLNTHRVIRATDAELSALHLLEMTFQTEIRVARGEHLGIHRAMRAVTRRAAFVHRFMLEHIRAALGGVTFQTRLILRLQRRAPAEMRCAFVGWMTFNASHLAFRHGMMTRQIKLAAHIAVTCETNLLSCPCRRCRESCAEIVRRRTPRRHVIRRFCFAAGFRVDAGGAVTGFATRVQDIWPAHRQHSVISRLK